MIAWIKELEKGFFSTNQFAYDYYKEEKTSNNEKAFYHKFCSLLWSKDRHSLPLQVMEQPRELFLVLKEIHFRYTLTWIRDFLVKWSHKLLVKWSHKLKLKRQILVCNSEFVVVCCLKSLTLEFNTFLSGWQHQYPPVNPLQSNPFSRMGQLGHFSFRYSLYPVNHKESFYLPEI